MAYLEWKEVCSVCVKDLDDQHKILFALINDYSEAVTRQMTGESTKYILKGLADFARTHFSNEESLMQRHYYPGYTTQKAQHNRFIAMINAYLRRAEEGSPTPPGEIKEFLKYWTVKHILAEDRQYGPFLNAQGVN